MWKVSQKLGTSSEQKIQWRKIWKYSIDYELDFGQFMKVGIDLTCHYLGFAKLGLGRLFLIHHFDAFKFNYICTLAS